MGKIFVPPNCCYVGDVLSDDVTNDKGIKIAVKNTIVNQFIIDKFVEQRIPCVWLFEPAELLTRHENEIKFKAVKDTYKDVVLNLKGVLNDLAVGGKMDYEKSVGVSNTIIGNIKESSHIIKCLTEIRTSDEYTYSHCCCFASVLAFILSCACFLASSLFLSISSFDGACADPFSALSFVGFASLFSIAVRPPIIFNLCHF